MNYFKEKKKENTHDHTNRKFIFKFKNYTFLNILFIIKNKIKLNMNSETLLT